MSSWMVQTPADCTGQPSKHSIPQSPIFLKSSSTPSRRLFLPDLAWLFRLNNTPFNIFLRDLSFVHALYEFKTIEKQNKYRKLKYIEKKLNSNMIINEGHNMCFKNWREGLKLKIIKVIIDTKLYFLIHGPQLCRRKYLDQIKQWIDSIYVPII
jgi:hypothetical protein